MRIIQPSGLSSFSHSSWEASHAVQQHERSRQAGHPQRRASEEAGCSKEFQQARPATEEEEAWLDTQEQLLHKQAEWLVQQAGSPSLYHGLEPELSDAEAFNRDDQLACWIQAQEEALAVQEAESFCLLEEEIELELLELAGEKDIKSHLMMKALREGAMFLVDEESAEKADYQSLVSIQQSAQKLLELVDRAMHAKVEEERRRVFNQVTLALLHKREIEDMAAVERGQLQSEINRLKQEHRDLHDLLEREKDRTTCRICFIRPRDVLPLPCTSKMCITQSYERPSFCQSLWKASEAFQHEDLRQARDPQRRVNDDTDFSKEFQHVRLATMEEDSWLVVEKQLLHEQTGCLVQQVGALSLHPSLESESFDAEAFNRDDELACWV